MRHSIRACVAASLLALAVVACGKHHGGGDDTTGDGGVTYAQIRINPSSATVTVPLDGTATQTYQVIGEGSGQEADITAECTLAIDPAFGTATAAIVTVGAHGGVANVTAACGALGATAQLTVNVTGSLTLGSNTPANAAQLFGSAALGSDAAQAPTIQYPIDKAVAPLNLPPIEVQWATAGGADLFHVSLTSPNQAIDIYTSDLQATLALTDWNQVAGTAAGQTLAVVVEGLAQAAPATKYASAPVSLVMSHDTIDTSAIYYWASSKGDIMTQTFGATDAPAVVEGNCSGCHSLSRAGTRIGYSRCVGGNCGPEYIGFLHYDGSGSGGWTEVVDADNKAIAGSYTTFAPVGNPFPDDTQSVAIITLTDGSMGLYDPDTGSAVASNLNTVSREAIDGTGAATNRTGMMPDWSADGTQIVYASTPNADFVDLDQGSIATMAYQYTAGQHVFGTPQTLVQGPITLPNGTYENLFFPSFSPDGKLVVFNAARKGWRDLSSGQGRTPGQRLMLADAAGSGYIDLTALNGGMTDLDVTWPHWAPGDTNDYYWIVFSSERDYGHEITQANTAAGCVENGMLQCKQIWIGAISKAQLAAGLTTMDPSAPPVWLPGQDPQADNISPYWTKPAGIQ